MPSRGSIALPSTRVFVRARTRSSSDAARIAGWSSAEETHTVASTERGDSIGVS